MKLIKYLTIIVLITVTIIGCNNDDKVEETINVEDARALQLTAFYDNQIIQFQSGYTVATLRFVTAAQDFKNNPTTETLLDVTTSWQEAFLSWKQIEPYTLGSVTLSFFHNRIQRWPIDPELIESAINSENEIDASFISTLGATRKGYSTAEYLLLDDTPVHTLSNFTGDNGNRRLTFLLALAQNISQESQSLLNAWQSIEVEFKTALSTSVNGSQNRLFNSMLAYLEFVKNTKLEEALNSQDADTTLFEAHRSGLSKEAITQNLNSLLATYTGNINTVDGFGFEEYLVQTLNNPNLNTEIIQGFNAVTIALDVIPESLESTLINNPVQLENLREALSNLVTLLKVDYASAANIIVTFSDNDGD